VTDISWDDFWQECYMVTHLIFTLSNWGELSLDKKLFIHEYEFIHRCAPIHLEKNDVHLVSECLECLKILGDNDNDIHVQDYMKWLLNVQDVNDGSWDPPDETPYNKFHATMCACQTLMVHKRRAHGPGIVNALDLLYEWHINEKMSVSMQSSFIKIDSGMSMDPRGREFVQLTDQLMLNILSKDESKYQGLAMITVIDNDGDVGDVGDDGDNKKDTANEINRDNVHVNSTTKLQSKLTLTKKGSINENDMIKKKKKKKESLLDKSTLTSIENCLQQLEPLQLEFVKHPEDNDIITKKFRILYKKLMTFKSPLNDKNLINRLNNHLNAVRKLAIKNNNEKLKDYTNVIFRQLLGELTNDGKLCKAVYEVKQLVENKDFLEKDEVNEQMDFWYTHLIPDGDVYTQETLSESGAIDVVKLMRKHSNNKIKQYGKIVRDIWKKKIRGSSKSYTPRFNNTISNDSYSSSNNSSSSSRSSSSSSSSSSNGDKHRTKKAVETVLNGDGVGNTSKKRPRSDGRNDKKKEDKNDGDERRGKKIRKSMNKIPNLKGSEYVGEEVIHDGKMGKVLRYFSGDEEDESVWKIVYDNNEGDEELEEDELKMAIYKFRTKE
jgi:hypothetical protein